MVESYLSRDAYPEPRWRQEGTQRLNACQDLEMEARLAEKNFRISVATYPLSIVGLALPFAFFFIGFTFALAVPTLLAFAYWVFHTVTLVDLFHRTGRAQYVGSLPHRVEEARRKYYTWLEEDSQPRTVVQVPTTMEKKPQKVLDSLEDVEICAEFYPTPVHRAKRYF